MKKEDFAKVLYVNYQFKDEAWYIVTGDKRLSGHRGDSPGHVFPIRAKVHHLPTWRVPGLPVLHPV